MSRDIRQLYKGKPSKMVKVLDEDVFTDPVYSKPPSANARKVWYQSAVDLQNQIDGETDTAVMGLITNLATDLILITNCDETGAPYFTKEHKQFLEEEMDQGYYDLLVESGSEMMNLNKGIKQMLQLKLGDVQAEDTEEPGKKPESNTSLSQTTPQNPQE